MADNNDDGDLQNDWHDTWVSTATKKGDGKKKDSHEGLQKIHEETSVEDNWIIHDLNGHIVVDRKRLENIAGAFSLESKSGEEERTVDFCLC